ncbi:MAG: CHAT domain-containing protein, partial [Hyphomicrobiales bacterium]
LLSMLGEKYCEIELWGEARRVFEECSAGLNELVASVEANSTDLTVSLGVLGKVAKFAPYACLMEGDWKSALELKEVGQARLLAKAISLNALPMTNEMRSAIVQLEKEWIALEGKLTSSRTFDRITPLKRIMSIRRELHKLVMDDGFHGTVESGVDAALQLLLSDDCTVAVPVVGSHGGKVLVFRKHGDEIKLQMRDIGSAFELDAILRVKQGVASGDAVRYASGRVRGVRGEGWLEEIEELSKGLRTAFVEPLFDALDDLGAEAGDQILIVGGGEVAALPFHIADIGEMGTTFLDQFEARISPSLAVSSAIISRGENPCSIRNGPITVVCQSDNPELVYLDVEAGLVSSWFSDRSILSAGEAETTADKVLMQLDGSSVWHFCCHGAFDDRDPLNSALQFSSARSLTLKDIVDARGLSPPSLVVLSACETGLHSLKQLPHEYIGLPTAFLQLGASAVVATQWQVGDLAAMLLMGKFYEQLVGDQKRPSEALRNAQLWLRDANVDALNQTMETWVKDGRMTEASMAKARTEFELERFRPASRPFQDKVFWGAFVLHGA